MKTNVESYYKLEFECVIFLLTVTVTSDKLVPDNQKCHEQRIVKDVCGLEERTDVLRERHVSTKAYFMTQKGYRSMKSGER